MKYLLLLVLLCSCGLAPVKSDKDPVDKPEYNRPIDRNAH